MTNDPSRDLAQAAADLAADGKALGITILDLRELSSVADYFVIASGRSHIQVEAICDRIEKGVAERLGTRPISVEGLENASWALIDYGSVVVHVFQESVRELYDLERLWSLAPRWTHEDSEPPRPGRGRSAASSRGDENPRRSARL
jgi:ribosome-associated protein